jgi:hypothetical protein
MAKYLRLDPRLDEHGALAGMNLRLPADANLDAISRDIELAMSNAVGVRIRIATTDDPLTDGYVVLHGQYLRRALVSEVDEHDS